MLIMISLRRLGGVKLTYTCKNQVITVQNIFQRGGRASSICISFSSWMLTLPNVALTELCEMVSVLVCILPSLVSVESMSWRQFLPLPRSLLVHYLTHPLARLTLEILFIAHSGSSSVWPIRSISAPFEGRRTNISPLQPQTPHVQ